MKTARIRMSSRRRLKLRLIRIQYVWNCSDLRTLPSLSYLKHLPTLQLLCLQTMYRVQFDRRQSGFILNAGFCQTINPSLTYSYSAFGPVIEYRLAVVIVVHFKRGLECLNTFLFWVYNESSTFYIFMLYILIHTVLAVEFVVVLWNMVYLKW